MELEPNSGLAPVWARLIGKSGFFFTEESISPSTTERASGVLNTKKQILDLALNFQERRALWVSSAGDTASGRSQQNGLQSPRDYWGEMEKCLPYLRAPGLGAEHIFGELLLCGSKISTA